MWSKSLSALVKILQLCILITFQMPLEFEPSTYLVHPPRFNPLTSWDGVSRGAVSDRIHPRRRRKSDRLYKGFNMIKIINQLRFKLVTYKQCTIEQNEHVRRSSVSLSLFFPFQIWSQTCGILEIYVWWKLAYRHWKKYRSFVRTNKYKKKKKKKRQYKQVFKY